MEHPVILSKLEQEYLLGAIEASLRVREPRSYFLWAQGQLQALLPHQILLCMQFGADGGLLRTECLHGTVLSSGLLERLAHPRDGLAPRLARFAQAPAALPLPLVLEAAAPGAPERQEQPLADWQGELHALGLANVLLHGSGALHGGATCFALFGMPQRPGPRQAYFMELLLAHMHLALLRLAAAGPAAASSPGGAGERACSRREMEILCWVREGKSNQEVGQILGISGLTVKNHLQRIYKTLGVSNRTQAVARGIALRLFDGPPAPQARA